MVPVFSTAHDPVACTVAPEPPFRISWVPRCFALVCLRSFALLCISWRQAIKSSPQVASRPSENRVYIYRTVPVPMYRYLQSAIL